MSVCLYVVLPSVHPLVMSVHLSVCVSRGHVCISIHPTVCLYIPHISRGHLGDMSVCLCVRNLCLSVNSFICNVIHAASYMAGLGI